MVATNPNDGIPVLTEVVDPVLPAIHEAAIAAARARAAELAAAIEARVMQRLAGQVDEMFEARLREVTPGVIESALAGIQAGLGVVVNAALHETIRDVVAAEVRDALGHPER